jgi:serine/threonine-protein kinase HipA
MADTLTIERFDRGQWLPMASTVLDGDPAGGIATPTVTAYEIDYAIDNLDRRDAAALSATLPVSLDAHTLSRWPAFLVDLLPQGYGREELLRQLGLPEGTGRPADWALLRRGAGNPIGHLRIREAYEWLATRQSPPTEGFSFDEVAARSDQFIEFLAANGLFVAGSSGVQGEWPKLLLTEDNQGRLHLDHTLPDDRASVHWLVKFGRGQDEMLARILELEAPYMNLARLLDVRVHGELQLRNRALFIPRFDRNVGPDGVDRIAQESIASLCGVADFGVSLQHDTVVKRLSRVCTDPEGEVIEYVRRDVLNLLMGNRDNHARNTALRRLKDGRISLTPLFDFAPMMLHPDGIARRSRWQNESGLSPDWKRVIEQCRAATDLALPELPVALRELRASMERLAQLAAQAGIPQDILERQGLSIAAVRESLAAV